MKSANGNPKVADDSRIQNYAIYVFGKGRVVICHMLQNDFGVLRLSHPSHLIRDTAKAPYAKLLAGLPTKPNVGLRTLTFRLFGIRIQTGEHCSSEDARAAMVIYRLIEDVWEADLRDQKPRRRKGRLPQDISLSGTDCDSVTSQRLMCLQNPDFTLSSNSVVPEQLSDRFVDQELYHLEEIRSISSTSLLDDVFWPAEDDETR